MFSRGFRTTCKRVGGVRVPESIVKQDSAGKIPGLEFPMESQSLSHKLPEIKVNYPLKLKAPILFPHASNKCPKERKE